MASKFSWMTVGVGAAGVGIGVLLGRTVFASVRPSGRPMAADFYAPVITNDSIARSLLAQMNITCDQWNALSRGDRLTRLRWITPSIPGDLPERREGIVMQHESIINTYCPRYLNSFSAGRVPWERQKFSIG
jgi:hypothetical protein